MRLWSLHPKVLDLPGLVALWREGLLAQAVLRGKTKGYTRHSQLVRFREQPSPLGATVVRIVFDLPGDDTTDKIRQAIEAVRPGAKFRIVRDAQ